MNYTAEQEADMIKTARASGAVGNDPLVYRMFRERFKSTLMSVLDYGSGDTMPHARKLAREGFTVHAMDLAFEPWINDHARNRGPFDVVLCSNVLNVQPSFHALLNVVYDLKSLMVPGGMLIINYPASPRKAGLHIGDVRTALLEAFGEYSDKFADYPGVFIVGA